MRISRYCGHGSLGSWRRGERKLLVEEWSEAADAAHGSQRTRGHRIGPEATSKCRRSFSRAKTENSGRVKAIMFGSRCWNV